MFDHQWIPYIIKVLNPIEQHPGGATTTYSSVILGFKVIKLKCVKCGEEKDFAR